MFIFPNKNPESYAPSGSSNNKLLKIKLGNRKNKIVLLS